MIFDRSKVHKAVPYSKCMLERKGNREMQRDAEICREHYSGERAHIPL